MLKNENQKKQSVVNVRMPKTNYEKALNYFKLEGKTPAQVSKKLNYKPSYIIKRKSGKKEKKYISDTNPNYEDKVREELIKRWKNETQLYIATYQMTYQKYNPKTKKSHPVVVPITVQGNKDSVLLEAMANFKRKLRQYEEDYPENDTYELNEDPTVLIPIPDSQAIRVVDREVQSSVSGGQRKVGKGGAKRHTKMRDAFSRFKFNDEIAEWDTNTGRCVFDYLIWKYGNASGFKKLLGYDRNDAYKFLNDLFKEDDIDYTSEFGFKEPLEAGVSVSQLEKFCDKFCIFMYAYDKDDDLIITYKPKKITSARYSLIFIVYDNHFYPVLDNHNRLSKARRGAIDNHSIASNVIAEFKTENIPTKKIIIAPTEDEYEGMRNDDSSDNNTQNKIALRYIQQNKGVIPFPINDKNLYVVDGTIHRIKYDDKIILTKPIDKYVEKFYNNTDIGFQGQSPQSVMNYIWDLMFPFHLSKAPFLSNTNLQVAEALRADNVKHRTHLGRISDDYSSDDIKHLLQNGNAIAVDITKCYCDCLYNQREPFIVFNGKEIVEPYDNEPLTLGLYFVETDDMTLFHKSNWYSKKIIELGISEKIPLQIISQIRCIDEEWTFQLEEDKQTEDIRTKVKLDNSNLFRKWIDSVVELTEQDEDFTLTKNVINSLSGYMGKTCYKSKKVGLSKNLDEVWDEFLVPIVQENPSINIYLNTIKDKEDEIYLFGYEKHTENLSNGLPIYIQLLDWSNMALYNMIKAVGGELVYRKTDCIISIGGTLPYVEDGPSYYTDTFGSYHLEDVDKALHFNLELLMNSDRYVDTPLVENEWNDYKFNSSDDWLEIIKTAIDKGGMMVSGRAGTGKSYIIHKGIEAKLLPEVEISRLAFTNRASRNIKGTTIHKALGINKNDETNIKTLQSLKKIPIFIVDEISMLSSKLWRYLMTLKEVTGAIFILLGDYRQCGPIENGKEIDYFTHPFAKRLVNGNRCELTKPQRYDLQLWNWLEKFYEYGYAGPEIQKKKLEIENIIYRKNIVYTNKTRTRINNLCMEYFIKDKNFIVLSKGEKCCNDKAETAYIYEGLPIMAVVNNKDLDIINSEEFIVKSISSSNSNMIVYRDEDPTDEFEVMLKEFHRNFVVNYAATTHKSQGATIEKDINIFDFYLMEDYDRRVGYTAVSRAKNCLQVTIAE
jgi:hypothetical protein